jgi:hypothetical protein
MHPDIHRRRVNAKYVLERASSVQAERNEMITSIAVLLLHDAIELLMIAVLDRLKCTGKLQTRVQGLLAAREAGHRQRWTGQAANGDRLNQVRVGLTTWGMEKWKPLRASHFSMPPTAAT